jgi:hypothetical protein
MKNIGIESMLAFFAFFLSILAQKYTGSVQETTYGFRGEFTLQGEGPFGNDAKTLVLEVYYETSNRAHVKVCLFIIILLFLFY